MKIAVEGCCHGQLDDIYGSIRLLEHKEGIKIDLVLICGDFQAIRNVADLECMAVPKKYQQIGTFHKYYSGSKEVPYPTVFIGGNHEASNYLWELFYGGWAAKNLYFLGWAGVIKFGGVRIAGSSGIFNAHHYNNGHYEKAPYSTSDMRSIYHVRKYDIRKLGLLRQPIDVMLTHDWPRGIEQFGDVQKLLRIKKHFRAEVARNDLGSRANEELLDKLIPKYWFSAHLHVKFPALVDHDAWMNRFARKVPGPPAPQPGGQEIKIDNPDEIVISMDDDDDDVLETPSVNSNDNTVDMKTTPSNAASDTIIATSNPDEIVMDDDDFDEPATTPVTTNAIQAPAKSEPIQTLHTAEVHDELMNETTEKAPALETLNQASQTTRFLSLDKCLPRRDFLQVLDVPSVDENLSFEYDLEWLAITQITQQYLSLQHHQPAIPSDNILYSQIDQKIEELQKRVDEGTLDLRIPNNFELTAPSHDYTHRMTPQEIAENIIPYTNPQTEAFCSMVGIENKFKSSRIAQLPPQKVMESSEAAVEFVDSGSSTPTKRQKLDLPPPTVTSVETSIEVEETTGLE
ncbi:lariat debranching enzyme, C-terminal domain-containing protein [Umbelopsis sp. AD052]|nr:lariat debranching enzyme, C-terminal domain-containing protein [Umbelopsis sp. AD052]